MSKVSITGNNSGTGTFTVAAPNSNNDRTFSLPDENGVVITDSSDIEPQVKTSLNATGDAPMFACRAFVNFNGTGTVSIRASGNVSSITDNGTGDYTVNFATTMEDADYSVTGINETSGSSRGAHLEIKNGSSFLTSSFNVEVIDAGPGALTDVSIITVAIFR